MINKKSQSKWKKSIILKSLKLKKPNRKKLKIAVVPQPQADAETDQVVHKNSKYEKAKEKTKSLWNRSKIMKGLNSLNLKKKKPKPKQEKSSTMKVIAMVDQEDSDDDEEFF